MTIDNGADYQIVLQVAGRVVVAQVYDAGGAFVTKSALFGIDASYTGTRRGWSLSSTTVGRLDNYEAYAR